VGVAADDGVPVDLLPCDDPLSDVSSVSGVICVAGPVTEPGELQLLHDVPGQQLACEMKPVALKVDLMAVYDEYLLAGSPMMKNQPLGRDDSVFLHPVALAVLDLVVAQDEVQSIQSIKPVQQIVDLAVSAPDVAEPAVLEQFVAVAYLDVRVAIVVVVL
jgi:hypothetical protein